MQGPVTYIVAQGADIWLGDGRNQRILKLDPTANLFTIWQLTGGAFPKGMAMEANGNLWWADEGLSRLGRLEPGINRLTAYPLPVGTQPEMIALSQGKAWYTELVSRTVGVLDPAVAAGSSSTLVKTTAPVTPACSNLGAGTSSSVSSSTQAWPGRRMPIPNSSTAAAGQCIRCLRSRTHGALPPAVKKRGLWIKAAKSWRTCLYP